MRAGVPAAAGTHLQVVGRIGAIGLAEGRRRALRIRLDEERDQEDDGDEEAKDHRQERAERDLEALRNRRVTSVRRESGA